MPVFADQVLNNPATELLLSDLVTDLNLVLVQLVAPVPVLAEAAGGEVHGLLSLWAL